MTILKPLNRAMIERALSVLHMINHDKEVTEVQQEVVVGRVPVLHRYQSTAVKTNGTSNRDGMVC